jgi:hypothetical protein
MKLTKFCMTFGMAVAVVFGAQIARAQDPVSAIGSGVEGAAKGVGGAVDNVAQGAGKGVTDVLDHVTGNKTVAPVAPAPVAPAPVVHHHHHHHHHH